MPSRPETELDHRARVEKALAFVARNLDRPITVAEVARAASLSEFHFHRVFSAVMGETVGEFVSRLRLERAALALAYHPRRSVTEIALSGGYSSVANFSKAFSAFFGVRPSDVRRPSLASRTEGSRLGKLTRKYGKDFDPAALYVLPEAPDDGERRRRRRAIEEGMRFEERETMAVACLSSPAGYDLEAVGRTWEDLLARGRELGLYEAEADAYGIAHDSPSVTAPELCRYHACIPLTNDVQLPPPLFRGEIPAGRYAVFRYAGPVHGVEDAYRAIYSVWFPESSLEPDDFHAIDRYVNGAPQDGAVDMEIWIKVRPRTA